MTATSNKLNINRLAEGLALALTVQYQQQYPGVAVTVKSVTPKASIQKTA